MSRNRKSNSNSRFSKLPAPSGPRSVFNRRSRTLTTLESGFLTPVYRDEVLPGDTFKMSAATLARLITPVVPVMDNLYMDTHWFFVPNRLLWDGWEDFITGKVESTVPIMEPFTATCQTLPCYFGAPINKLVSDCIALPFRAYNKIYQDWYLAQDVMDEATLVKDDGPDTISDYAPRRRAKRHDYFTSCLPWPQKGDAISLPLGTTAPVIGDGNGMLLTDANEVMYLQNQNPYVSGNIHTGPKTPTGSPSSGNPLSLANRTIGLTQNSGDSGLITDLSNATAATINSLRESFQLQRMLEKDARGGSRYIEQILVHFGVTNGDARLQRSEYLGGQTQQIGVIPVPQTSETATTEQGGLAAYGLAAGSAGGFNKTFTEHGQLICIASVRADLHYQQGIPRDLTRQTRYDYYWPALAHLGEQAVLNKEIYYQDGPSQPQNEEVFGYQEAYAEYRYKPSMITGKMRSDATGSLDVWHLGQDFSSLPSLGQAFMQENPPIDRITAVADEPDIKFDGLFELNCARLMPSYSIPGYIDHF